MVEGADQGSVVRLCGGLAGLDADAFDFTVFLLIMVPIAKEFGVPLTEVAIVFTLTLWMRLVGAVGLGLDGRPDRAARRR